MFDRQAAQQRPVHLVAVGRLAASPDPQLAGDEPELAVDVLPLADPEVVEELGLAAPAELARRRRRLELLHVVPEGEVAEEVGRRVPEAGVELVGRLPVLDRSLPRVLDGEGGGDHEHLAGTAEAIGLEHHPRHAWVDRELGHAAAVAGERAVTVERAELLEHRHAVAPGAPVGRIDERELGRVAEADGRHLEQHRGQVRPQDLGVGELGPAEVVVLGVQADAHAGPDAPAAPGPLVGRRARDTASIGRRCTLVRRL